MAMTKKTIYLPADLTAAVESVARHRGVSEAEIMREAIRVGVAGERPKSKGGLFASNQQLSERVDELLAGLGER